MHEAFPVILIFYCWSVLLINEDSLKKWAFKADKYLIELAFQGSFDVL